MNKKELLLGDYFEAGKGRFQNSKQSPTTEKLEQALEQNYLAVSQLVSREDLQIELDPDLEEPLEQLTHLVGVIHYLLGRQKPENQCEDCQNYQKHLQKLEADVRQHIRLEQQLKLYQDSIEEKNQQFKRENKQLEKEVDNLKKKNEQFKHLQEKVIRLEAENEQLRGQFKINKPKKNESLQKPSSSQSQYRKFDTKTNIPEKYPLTRTINFSSNINSNEQRKSIDRKHVESRTDMQKYRQSLNNKSTNTLRPPTDRRKYEDKCLLKDKENERRRTNKMDFRK